MISASTRKSGSVAPVAGCYIGRRQPMRHASFAFVLPLTLALGVSARAQATLPTEWDMRKTLESITSHSDRLMPLLDQVRPKDWVVSGASQTYLQQWNSAR